MNTPSLLRAIATASLVTASLLVACGDDDTGSSGTSSGGVTDASTDARRVVGPFRPANTSCPVLIETHELLLSAHVPEATAVTYNSSPPSSGQHYSIWANFKEYGTPLDDRNLVHSLEHGAVALLHKCQPADPGCSDTIAALRKIRDSIPTDPVCSGELRVRVIIAPYPKLDTPVGAVAWGTTYKGDCVDVPTLTQFVNDNYAKAPENFCNPGFNF